MRFDARIIVDRIVERLDRALRSGDYSVWSDTIVSDDDIAVEAQHTWFKGYALDHKPRVVNLKVLDVRAEQSRINAECRVSLTYDDYDSVEEVHNYTIERSDESDAWRIVWLEKKASQLSKGISYVHDRIRFPSGEVRSSDRWWEDHELVSYVGKSRDPLPRALYVRAITRNVRFREACPLLECAALLANMMSLHVVEIAKQLYDPDALQLLANVYNGSIDRVKVRLVRPDRDNSWVSKYLAPWYGFDEMLAMCNSDGMIVGNCSPVLSFYYAVLRLAGFAQGNLFQLRMNNQDVIFALAGSDAYLLCSDMLVRLSPKTLYHSNHVTKLYDEWWIWTSRGITNMDSAMQDGICAMFAEKAQSIVLPEKLGNAVLHGPGAYVGSPSLSGIQEPADLCRKIKEYIFEMSNAYPDSSATWAKYAYQTLFVPMPETYAAWGMQSPGMIGFAKEHSSGENVLRALGSFRRKSVFPEPDRIMTPDQVLRHGTGDAKSKALFLFTWNKIVGKKEASVLFTDKGSYCMWSEECEWKYWDAAEEKMVDAPSGKTLLAFDDTYSYYPLAKTETIVGNKPIWSQVVT
jgi:hypothetical protein